MVESELGPMPEEWEVKRLKDVAGVNELSIKTSCRQNGFTTLTSLRFPRPELRRRSQCAFPMLRVGHGGS